MCSVYCAVLCTVFKVQLYVQCLVCSVMGNVKCAVFCAVFSVQCLFSVQYGSCSGLLKAVVAPETEQGTSFLPVL